MYIPTYSGLRLQTRKSTQGDLLYGSLSPLRLPREGSPIYLRGYAPCYNRGVRKMYLDIETVPAEKEKEEVLLELYNRKLKNGNKNLTTFEDYLEATGLDGAFGRICCIGYAIDDQPAMTVSGTEKEMLTKFWDAASGVNLFVGFNLMDFDLRFIYQRSIINRVKPSQELSFARYRNSPIYDVMHEWSRWSNLGRTGLHGLAKALGLPSSKEGEIEGRGVAAAYKAGRIAEICKYCEADVEVTRKIYKIMTFQDGI